MDDFISLVSSFRRSAAQLQLGRFTVVLQWFSLYLKDRKRIIVIPDTDDQATLL